MNMYASKDIDELELSVRASSALLGAGIQTVGQLVAHTEAELLRIPNFARKSLSDLNNALVAEGLSTIRKRELEREEPSPRTLSPLLPLACYGPEDRIIMTGREGDLPKAKDASEPYYYSGDLPPPVPHGTKISLWNYDPQNKWAPWWSPTFSSKSTWQKPWVFRIRNYRDPLVRPATDEYPALVARAVNALESIAASLKGRMCETDGSSE